MVQLQLQKRLAASELKCGKRRVFIEPSSLKEIKEVNSREGVRKLIREGYISKKRTNAVSRYRIRKHNAAKRLGRHTGAGKRRGTREARTPSKGLWIERQRILRRMLIRYRDNKHMDAHLYHSLYNKCKGNEYRTKAQLLDAIIQEREKRRAAAELKKELEARQLLARQRREARINEEEARHLAIALGHYKPQRPEEAASE